MAAPTVRLTWVASADDGAGDADVVAYEVARSAAPLPTVVVGTVAVTPAPDDTVFADAPGLGTWHYRTRAVDDAGNRSPWTAGVVAVVTEAGVALSPASSTATARTLCRSAATARTLCRSAASARPAYGSGASARPLFRSAVSARPLNRSRTSAQPLVD